MSGRRSQVFIHLLKIDSHSIAHRQMWLQLPRCWYYRHAPPYFLRATTLLGDLFWWMKIERNIYWSLYEGTLTHKKGLGQDFWEGFTLSWECHLDRQTPLVPQAFLSGWCLDCCRQPGLLTQWWGSISQQVGAMEHQRCHESLKTLSCLEVFVREC